FSGVENTNKIIKKYGYYIYAYQKLLKVHQIFYLLYAEAAGLKSEGNKTILVKKDIINFFGYEKNEVNINIQNLLDKEIIGKYKDNYVFGSVCSDFVCSDSIIVSEFAEEKRKIQHAQIEKIEKQNQKFETMEKKLETMEQELKPMEKKLETIENQMYNNILTFMGTFISIFSLISINFSMFSSIKDIPYWDRLSYVLIINIALFIVISGLVTLIFCMVNKLNKGLFIKFISVIAVVILILSFGVWFAEYKNSLAQTKTFKVEHLKIKSSYEILDIH
ncbi:MAG: hypothetical protein WBG30_09335, partial [Psychrilyobacter sp.]|uniref:hypothetical protein n=1 Tax=Psychrilyobacter sp. TaxID=2586924 RepID=UPI003C720D95